MKQASEIIFDFFKKRGRGEKLKLITLWKNWNKIMGDGLCKMAKPIGTKGRTLIIGVEDSILMQELSFFSDNILEKIEQFLGYQPFDKIMYKLLEDRTSLDGMFVEVKKTPYIPKLPVLSGRLKDKIPKESPVYRAYMSYLKLIEEIKRHKEETHNE